MVCLVSAAQETPKPVVSPDAMSSERMGIYRGFLSGYSKGSGRILNVAQTTDPFTPPDFDKSCLKTFTAARLKTPMLHTFASDAFTGPGVRLVDPSTHKKKDPGDLIRQGEPVDDAVDAGLAAGLFTFSEIVFNARHTRAAFSYAFVCGRLCGHGNTVFYALVKGKWKQNRAQCGGWVS